jgi:hypothetical protein
MINALFFLLAALVLIVLIPVSLLWMLNTLFKLQIRYGFDEWLAAVVLMLFIGAAAVL